MTSGFAENVLYVGTPVGASSIGGREQLSRLIRDALRAIVVGDLEILELPRAKF